MTGIDDPEMALLGYMISYDTWKKFILASSGSETMKRGVIEHVRANVPIENGLIDSFRLGLALGQLIEKLREEIDTDFSNTIVLSKNLDNVPIVRARGRPVS